MTGVQLVIFSRFEVHGNDSFRIREIPLGTGIVTDVSLFSELRSFLRTLAVRDLSILDVFWHTLLVCSG